jgi:hypothetical protein
MSDTPNGDFAPTTPEADKTHRTLYNRDGARPLPPPAKGEFHSYRPSDSVIERREADLFAVAGLDAGARDQLRQTGRAIQNQTGLPDALVATIIDGHIDNVLADARVSEDPEADGLALERQIAASNAELREKFTLQYGAKDGEALLERSARFIRAHPTLARMLQRRGLGSRPAIVEGVAAHVHSTGWR